MNETHKIIKVIQGDITTMDLDVIVNAANSSLMGGGGVDGAIHRKGGSSILKQCKTYVEKHGKLPTGEVMLTEGGDLPAKYVIHTVGPIWNGGSCNEHQKLSNCYRNALQLASNKNLKTIAFPNISTGVYRFPKKHAAQITIDTIFQFLDSTNTLEKVYLVCYDSENFLLIKKELENHN